MNLWDNLITVGVLFGLFIIAYCRITGKTIGDLFRDIMDVFRGDTEETTI